MTETALEPQQLYDNNDKTSGHEAMKLLLSLVAGELKLSVKDATGSVQSLTKTFMDMVNDVHLMLTEVEKAKASGEKDQALEAINKLGHQFLDKVQDGTIGFQFYDKLTQRLTHSTVTLKSAANLLKDEDAYKDSGAWAHFRKDMRSRYNTEQDRAMFESLMSGKTIKEAVRLANDAPRGKTGEVDLF